MKKKILALGLAVTLLGSFSVFAEEAEVAGDALVVTEAVEEVEATEEAVEEEATEEVAEETTEEETTEEEAAEEVAEEETAEEAVAEETAEEAEEETAEEAVVAEAQAKFWMLTVTGAEEEMILAKDEENEYKIDLTESKLFDNKGEVVEKDAFAADAMIKVFAAQDAEEGVIKADAAVVILEDCQNGVDVDFYTASEEFEGLINAKGDLVIRVTEETQIVPEDGTKILLTAEDLKDKKLVVFYDVATLSLPAQATPSKVIVLAEEAVEEETEEVVEKMTVVVDAADVKEVDGKIALPVRKISEALGLSVEWDAELQAVTVGTIPMGVNFKLGENAYNKSRMMPAALEFAPTLIVIDDMGYTYVPQGFFTDILEAEVTVAEDGSVTVVR